MAIQASVSLDPPSKETYVYIINRINQLALGLVPDGYDYLDFVTCSPPQREDKTQMWKLKYDAEEKSWLLIHVLSGRCLAAHQPFDEKVRGVRGIYLTEQDGQHQESNGSEMWCITYVGKSYSISEDRFFKTPVNDKIYTISTYCKRSEHENSSNFVLDGGDVSIKHKVGLKSSKQSVLAVTWSILPVLEQNRQNLEDRKNA